MAQTTFQILSESRSAEEKEKELLVEKMNVCKTALCLLYTYKANIQYYPLQKLHTWSQQETLQTTDTTRGNKPVQPIQLVFIFHQFEKQHGVSVTKTTKEKKNVFSKLIHNTKANTGRRQLDSSGTYIIYNSLPNTQTPT